jgi:hypothetical protein
MARGDADTRLADHNWKAEHIVPSSQRTVAKALQVNLASVGDEEDDLVDVLAIGTRVTRYPDVKGAISAFNVGRGKFVDPLYKETMEDMRALWAGGKLPSEAECSYIYCSYTVTTDNGRQIRVPCSDLHFEWQIESPIVEVVADSISFLAYPSTPRLLVVTGIMFKAHTCFYLKAIKATATADIAYDVLDFDRSELLLRLQSGLYSSCFMVGVGANGPSALKLLDHADMKRTMSAWIRLGGRLILQGEGCVAKLMTDWAGTQWHTAGYFRCQQFLNLPLAERFGMQLLLSYSAKAVYLTGVDEACVLYVSADEDGACSFALKQVGLGILAFVGDVNAEVNTISTILAITTCCSPTRAADEM